MKISKITKLLPLAVAFVMATTGAYAEGAAGATTEETFNTQTLNYSLDLQPFLDIETIPGETQTTSNTSFGANYTTLTVDTQMKAGFQVIGNQASQSVALSATCPGSTAAGALYNVASGQGAGLRIIFANSNTPPASIETMKETYTTASSPNAIAFTLTPSYVHEETPTQGFLNTDAEDNLVDPSLADGKIIYTVPNGKHTFKYLIGTTAVDNSFSTLDTNGTYTATLTLAKHPAP